MATLNHKESHGPKDVCNCNTVLSSTELASKFLNDSHRASLLLIDADYFLSALEYGLETDKDKLKTVRANINSFLTRPY